MKIGIIVLILGVVVWAGWFIGKFIYSQGPLYLTYMATKLAIKDNDPEICGWLKPLKGETGVSIYSDICVFELIRKARNPDWCGRLETSSLKQTCTEELSKE